VTGERVEIAIERLDVHLQVRRGLGAIHHHDRADGVGDLRELRGRIHRAERVGHVRKRDDLGGALERATEVGEIDASVLGDLDHPQRGALLLTQDLPRHEVRVMVHAGDHDRVPCLERGAPV